MLRKTAERVIVDEISIDSKGNLPRIPQDLRVDVGDE